MNANRINHEEVSLGLTLISSCVTGVVCWLSSIWTGQVPPCEWVVLMPTLVNYYYFFRDFIYLFLQRGEEKERNIDVREKH